ncbi:NAD(P)-binding protein [Nemania abortiva]|nr:NAD(P)-binding protein [Nemania abortiva]
MELDGVALVVGGAGGIGRACAEAFASYGACGIIVADIDLTAAQAVSSRCMVLGKAPKFQADSVHMDVTIEKSVEDGVKYASEAFGRIDYCVICAGVGAKTGTQLLETTLPELVSFMDVNVIGTFLVTRAVSAIMKLQDLRPVSPKDPERGVTRGAITIMGSLSSFVPTPGLVGYTTSKHAVLGLARSAALDNVQHSIRVNCVCPSWVDTPMVQSAKEGVAGLEEMISSLVPMGRMARPQEVADTVLFLCSPMSSYTTGIALVVDGGTSLGSKL